MSDDNAVGMNPFHLCTDNTGTPHILFIDFQKTYFEIVCVS